MGTGGPTGKHAIDGSVNLCWSLKPRIIQGLEQLLEKQQALLKANKGARFTVWLAWLWAASCHWANVLSKSQCWLKEWTQQIFLASPLPPLIYVFNDQKQQNSSCAFTSTKYEMLQWKLTWGFPLGYMNIKTFCGKMLFRGREKIRLGFSCFNSSPDTSSFTWSRSALFLNLCNKRGIHISLWYVSLWYFAEDQVPMFPLRGADFLENYISHKASKHWSFFGHMMPVLFG